MKWKNGRARGDSYQMNCALYVSGVSVAAVSYFRFAHRAGGIRDAGECACVVVGGFVAAVVVIITAAATIIGAGQDDQENVQRGTTTREASAVMTTSGRSVLKYGPQYRSWGLDRLS